ncbi:MAG: nickel-dependent hydrogenase large subunit [Candidatus Hodarchaeota archaeon]
MKKVIDICTRVEGHGNVNIFLENQNEEISEVNFEISIFRGFENILLRKELLDIPKIISRVCGLCYASQSIASCKAIENLYDIEVPEQSILLRRLLLTGELIKSHSMHFFFHSLPDLLEIFNILENTPSPYEIINYDLHLTTNFYELIKIGNEINKIFGGRAVHCITQVPGGNLYFPSRKNITIARKYLQKAIFSLEWIIEKFIELFSAQTPPIDYELPNCTFFGLHSHGKYDRYSGILGIKQFNHKIINFLDKNYSKYLDKDPDLRGINFFMGKNILVGPLARQKIIEDYGKPEISTYLSYFDNSWQYNILFSTFIKLLEMYMEAKLGLEILQNPMLDNKISLPTLKSIKNSDGIGVVEAPRGTLMHHYTLNRNNEIDEIKLYIATEINLPLINIMITDYARKLYEKHDINLVKEKIQKIIRAFDPCISCATH